MKISNALQNSGIGQDPFCLQWREINFCNKLNLFCHVELKSVSLSLFSFFLSSSLLLSSLLISSIFSLLLLCVVAVCVLLCFCWVCIGWLVLLCVVVVVVVVVVMWRAWRGTLKTPVCPSKTPPCVRSKSPRVCGHHAHMLKHMCAWCPHARGRKHGGVSGGHTEGVVASSVYQNLPTEGYHVPQRFTKQTFGPFPFSSLRKGREQHVPDSSYHSLYLIKLLSSSYPEGNCGRNKLLNGSISLSTPYPSFKNVLPVDIETSFS